MNFWIAISFSGSRAPLTSGEHSCGITRPCKTSTKTLPPTTNPSSHRNTTVTSHPPDRDPNRLSLTRALDTAQTPHRQRAHPCVTSSVCREHSSP